MSSTDELVPVLKRLKLSGVLQTMELRTSQAVEDGLPYPEYLYRLLKDEVERREGKQLQQRLRRASFDSMKTLEDFDFAFNPGVPKSRVIDMATTRFVDKKENVLIVGPTGVGKSHLAQALGVRACQAGHRSLYVPAHQLLTDLRAARADDSYETKMRKYCGVDLLIVDDLGLRPLSHDEPLDLYELVRRRYERGAMIITSNRDVPEWYSLFGDPLLASAAMDRLLHHAHVLRISADARSYRNPLPEA